MRIKEPKVSPMGFWLDNAFEPEKFVLVDCGYVRHFKARANADRLLKATGASRRSCCQIVGAGRIIVRVFKAKQAVLNKFRSIQKGGGYCWTTHIYEKGGVQFDLKFAA